MAYHWTENTGTETIDDLTITVDNVQQTIPGGTQASLLQTEGWGWLFGGGGEVWHRPVDRPLRGPELRVHHRFSQIGGGGPHRRYAPVHRLRRARPHRPPLSEDRAGYCTLSNSMSNTSDA